MISFHHKSASFVEILSKLFVAAQQHKLGVYWRY